MKYNKYIYGVLVTSFISGCSYFEPKQDNIEPVDVTQNTQEVSSSFKEKSLVKPVKKEVALNKPSVKDAVAKVDLTLDYTVLKSKQIVTWNDISSGLILFRWIPPKGSTCKATAFPIKKYKDTNSLTSANRSLYDPNHKPCIGTWTVEVVEKPDNILASAEIIVSNIKSSKSLESTPKSPSVKQI